MSSFNGSVSDPYWFDPVGLHLSAVGPDDPAYQWWSQAVRGSLGQFLVQMVPFCIAPEPLYQELTEENLQALGLKELYRQWMQHYLWTITTNV